MPSLPLLTRLGCDCTHFRLVRFEQPQRSRCSSAPIIYDLLRVLEICQSLRLRLSSPGAACQHVCLIGMEPCVDAHRRSRQLPALKAAYMLAYAAHPCAHYKRRPLPGYAESFREALVDYMRGVLPITHPTESGRRNREQPAIRNSRKREAIRAR
jgi:hypothetical protein